MLTLSVEAVILERMGLSTENATRQLAKISFKEHDVTALLAETQATARIFLDAMQKSVNLQVAENVDVPENNPLLDKLGVIQSQEKIEQTPDSESKSKEEPVQLGLFDAYTTTQPNNANETKSIVFEEEILESDETTRYADESLTASAENVSKGNNATIIETTDTEPIDEISSTENTTEVADEVPIDTTTDERDNSAYEVDENIELSATSDVDKSLTATDENVNEENVATITEPVDVEPVEEISSTENAGEVVDDVSIDTTTNERDNAAYKVDENIELSATSDVDKSLTATDENVNEENVATITEPVDVEPVEEISSTENAGEVVDYIPIDTATDEQDNSDYDFDEMDEEEEILPSNIEKQSNVEILPQEDSQAENISSEQNQMPEENSNPETPTEDVKPDLQTILAEDMLAIRGNSVEKNIFRKNVIAIRTLQHIEREKRPATPKEIQILKEYSGFGGIPKAFDKNDTNWNREAWLLQSMLTEKEYNAARASTLNAHYTPSEIIQGIYSGLENLGFNQGTILEPSMGVGVFFCNMPDEIKNNHQ